MSQRRDELLKHDHEITERVFSAMAPQFSSAAGPSPAHVGRTRDVAEFWIDIGERKVDIRYWPLRGDDRRYLGTLETVQDVTAIRSSKASANCSTHRRNVGTVLRGGMSWLALPRVDPRRHNSRTGTCRAFRRISPR